MSGSSTGLVTLSCEHTVTFKPAPPVPGEVVFCRWCKDYRKVSETVRQLAVRCRDCRYSRRMGVGGASDLTTRDALSAASRHVMKNVDHVVDVTDTDGVVETISNNGQGELPFASIVRDRIAASNASQKLLRTAFEAPRKPVEPRSA